jgi:hypothetical protein
MARGLDSGGQGEASVLAAVSNGEGNCALHLAAAAGRVEVCRYIVEDLRLDVDQLNLKGFVLVPSPPRVSQFCSLSTCASLFLLVTTTHCHVKFVFQA